MFNGRQYRAILYSIKQTYYSLYNADAVCSCVAVKKNPGFASYNNNSYISEEMTKRTKNVAA